MNFKLKLTLILSLFGMLVLTFISSQIEPPISYINNLSVKNLGQTVKLNITIVNIREFAELNFQILMIEDRTGNINAIMNSKKALNLDKNKTYLLVGKIQDYNNTLQMNIDKITS